MSATPEPPPAPALDETLSVPAAAPVSSAPLTLASAAGRAAAETPTVEAGREALPCPRLPRRAPTALTSGRRRPRGRARP
jgi:hypothetical protein